MKFLKFDKNFTTSVLPFLVIYLILSVCGVWLLNRLFFSIAYFWHVLLAHPKLQDRAESKRYRLAFLRLIYILNIRIQSGLNKKDNYYLGCVIRLFQPLTLIIILVLIGGRGNPIYSLAGSVIFESLTVLFFRFKKFSH